MSAHPKKPAAAKPAIVVVCGPTGSGKTRSAILLAERHHGRIIGADSMQIYRQMDIGTAKPTREEQNRIQHYMIDIIEPDEDFNAGRYAEMATRIITRLDRQGIVPFVVGGTGLYIKSLVHGIFQAKSVDAAVRRRLKAAAAADGPGPLFERLKRCDPDAAERIHPNDTYRIIRALEVFEVSGKALSAHHRQHHFGDTRFRVLKIGLNVRRGRLYERINRRVDEMIHAGLLEEVKRLLQKGYDLRYKSMQALGYRHMLDFIENRVSWSDTVAAMKRDTRRYAKRQMTWFGRDETVQWLPADHLAEMQKLIDRFLKKPS